MIDLGLPIETVPLAFLDVETTGLNPSRGDRVCEVAVLRTRAETIEIEWSRLVNPQRPIGYGAFRVNGISGALVASAPCFGEIADELLGILHGTVLVAHNALFDLAFLKLELDLAQRPLPSLIALDTLRLARNNVTASGYSLAALAAMYGIVHEDAHRALGDVRATHQLFRRMVRLLRARGVSTVGDLLRAQGGVLRDRSGPAVVAAPAVRRALQESSCLRIRYRDTHGSVTERIIRPTQLSVRFGQTYLVAYCFLRRASRTFAMDRIEAMEPVDAPPERGS